MQDIWIYQIEVLGQVDEIDLNAISLLEIKIEQVNPTSTQFTVCTDQSGLIGLMRYLHNLGFVFLSVYCQRRIYNEFTKLLSCP
jgi:hypothetical protein